MIDPPPPHDPPHQGTGGILDSRLLNEGDVLLLQYNHVGGTVAPPRIVRVTRVDERGFKYWIERIWVSSTLLGKGQGMWLSAESARQIGIRFRSGRSIQHRDFKTNMARASKLLQSGRQGE